MRRDQRVVPNRPPDHRLYRCPHQVGLGQVPCRCRGPARGHCRPFRQILMHQVHSAQLLRRQSVFRQSVFRQTRCRGQERQLPRRRAFCPWDRPEPWRGHLQRNRQQRHAVKAQRERSRAQHRRPDLHQALRHRAAAWAARQQDLEARCRQPGCNSGGQAQDQLQPRCLNPLGGACPVTRRCPSPPRPGAYRPVRGWLGGARRCPRPPAHCPMQRVIPRWPRPVPKPPSRPALTPAFNPEEDKVQR